MKLTKTLAGEYDQQLIDQYMAPYYKSAQATIDELTTKLLCEKHGVVEFSKGSVNKTNMHVSISYIVKHNCLRTHVVFYYDELPDKNVIVDAFPLLDQDVCPKGYTRSFRRHNNYVMRQLRDAWNSGYKLASIEVTKKGAVETYAPQDIEKISEVLASAA